VEEELFAGGEDEILAAIHAFEYSVLEFHGFPFSGPELQRTSTTFPRRVVPIPDKSPSAAKTEARQKDTGHAEDHSKREAQW
jgi:hypothetical protein